MTLSCSHDLWNSLLTQKHFILKITWKWSKNRRTKTLFVSQNNFYLCNKKWNKTTQIRYGIFFFGIFIRVLIKHKTLWKIYKTLNISARIVISNFLFENYTKWSIIWALFIMNVSCIGNLSWCSSFQARTFWNVVESTPFIDWGVLLDFHSYYDDGAFKLIQPNFQKISRSTSHIFQPTCWKLLGKATLLYCNKSSLFSLNFIWYNQGKCHSFAFRELCFCRWQIFE